MNSTYGVIDNKIIDNKNNINIILNDVFAVEEREHIDRKDFMLD